MTRQDFEETDATAGRLVLYIEDNAINPEFMKLFFDEPDDHRLFAAASAAAGIELAQQLQPDLILVDIDLPGVDGIEAARQLKSQPHTAQVPVITLSASAMAGDIDRAGAAAYDACVTRPFKLAEFTAWSRQVLERFRD